MGGGQSIKKFVKGSVGDFNEISAIQRIDAGLDLRAQGFQP